MAHWVLICQKANLIQPLDYEEFVKIWAVLGHGGIVAFDDTVDMAKMARYAFEFCAIESCGKCTPCRIGSTRGLEVIDKITAQKNGNKADHAKSITLVRDLSDTMLNGSLCALGGMTPYPICKRTQSLSSRFRITRSY